MPLFFDESSNAVEIETLPNVLPRPKTFTQFQHDNEDDPDLSDLNLRGPLNHVILAVAHFNSDNETVSIDFFDSGKDVVKKGIVRRTARNLIRNSGWLRDTWPVFGDEEWLVPPQQHNDTSGIHTVLNAWATMTNLPLKTQPDITISPRFYAEALRLINLGLAGKLDSRTIRAFFQCYEYVQPQDWGAVRTEEATTSPNKEHGLRNIQTVLMNGAVLAGTVADMHRQEDFQAGPCPVGRPRLPRGTNTAAAWQMRFRKGLDRNRNLRHRLTNNPITQIRSPLDMEDDLVVLGVASIWEGLRAAGFQYAFGTCDTFRANRTEATKIEGLTAVLRPHPLIMPLLFNMEMPDTPDNATTKDVNKVKSPPGSMRPPPRPKGRTRRHDPIGHHLLAVAERISLENDKVKISIFDSRPGTVPLEDIHEAANGLVRHTGWMGVDSHGNPATVWPEFVHEVITTPSQQGGNTCGFYLIFNAWAKMLGIPINPYAGRVPGTTPWRAFRSAGLEMINLALAGCMDSGTIQAFLNLHGYSVSQDPTDPTVHVVHMNAAAMDSLQLEDIMTKLRAVEVKRVQDFEGASVSFPHAASASVPEADSQSFPETDMLSMVRLGLTHEEAYAHLVDAAGSLEVAKSVFFNRVVFDEEHIALLMGFQLTRRAAEDALIQAGGDVRAAVDDVTKGLSFM